MVTLPTLSLTILILGSGAVLFYHFYSQSIRDELSSTTNMMVECLDMTVRGDYKMEEDVLKKGNLNMSDSTMLYHVKEKSNIDTTIFWGNMRVLTTIEDSDGISAAGTKADKQVADIVLDSGKDYFADGLKISGIKYIGYYKALKNSDGKIVGMVFAGKKQNIVYMKILRILILFGGFSILAVAMAVVWTKKYSTAVISDINGINRFLQTISEGMLGEKLDECIKERNDELGLIGMYADKMREKLQKLVEMDALTSLYNRRSGNQLLETLVEQGDEYTAVMCDIDHFKRVNDTYGHASGDKVLIEISRKIRENIREDGFASRWGGEEFLLIYRMSKEETRERVGMLQEAIRNLVVVCGDCNVCVTMTFGIAAGKEDDCFEKVIKNADEKLYIGKNGGRDRIVAD